MRYSVFCSSENYNFNLEIDSMDDESIKEIIGDIFHDEIENALNSYNTPIGFFPNMEELSDGLYSCAEGYIDKELADVRVYLRKQKEPNSNCMISEKPLDTIQALSEILKERQDWEYKYIDTGRAAITCLDAFLKQGCWQFGLQKSAGCINCDPFTWPEPDKRGGSIVWKDASNFLTPVIWFGIKGELPIECWTISKNTNGLKALGGGWTFNWDVLFDGGGEAYIVWMFAECDMKEPSIRNLIESCPVKIDDKGCSETLERNLGDFFFSTWKNQAQYQKDK